MSGLLTECSRSEKVLRERLEAAAGEGDAKARLATMRSELEAVSLERDALVSRARFPHCLALPCLALPCAFKRVPRMIGLAQESQACHHSLDWGMLLVEGSYRLFIFP